MGDNKDYISKPLEHGEVLINEDVIATIASAAIKDIEGVAAPGGSLLGKKNSAKGIHVLLGEDTVSVSCELLVLYGHSVVDVAKNVQSSVTAAIESMTGLTVTGVNVNVSGISMAK